MGKIKVYDIDAMLRKELDLEAFNYKKAAVFEGSSGYVFAEHEAVHQVIQSLDEEIELSATTHPDPGKIWGCPNRIVTASLQDILDTASYEEVDMEDFFDRRNYNPRCQSNYTILLGSLRKIGFDLQSNQEKKASLTTKIQSAEDKKTMHNETSFAKEQEPSR